MRSGVQRQRPAGEPQWPQGQGRVAFLPWLPVTLKCLKQKEPDFEPRTLGEHLKRCRIQRRLNQVEAARILKVNPSTILNWEKGHTEPPVEAMPALVQFLGYDPSPEPQSLPERLLAKRRAMGWSIRKAARKLEIDVGTWRDWEQGGVILRRSHRNIVARLLDMPEDEVDRDMEVRWIRSHQ